MPITSRLQHPRLRNLWQCVDRDKQLTPGAKDSLLKFLRQLEPFIQNADAASGAIATAGVLQRDFDGVRAVIAAFAPTDVPVAAMSTSELVTYFAQMMNGLRAQRQDERAAMAELGLLREEESTHGNVMRLLTAKLFASSTPPPETDGKDGSGGAHAPDTADPDGDPQPSGGDASGAGTSSAGTAGTRRGGRR